MNFAKKIGYTEISVYRYIDKNSSVSYLTGPRKPPKPFSHYGGFYPRWKINNR